MSFMVKLKEITSKKQILEKKYAPGMGFFIPNRKFNAIFYGFNSALNPTLLFQSTA